MQSALAGFAVETMPIDALKQRGRAVRGSRMLMLGIACKKNVDDARGSSSTPAASTSSRPRTWSKPRDRVIFLGKSGAARRED